MCKDNEKNVLLFAMSTLPVNPSVNIYKYDYDGEEWFFNGISQLEPGTKLVLSLLEKQRKKLDKIVILASYKASNDKYNINGKNISSVDFYKNRIMEYIHKDKAKEEVGDSCKQHYIGDNYSDIVEDDFFSIIDTDNNSEYLIDAVNAVRWYKPCKVNLYIDVQGGYRTLITQMNSVIELLKKEDVTIKNRFVTNYIKGEQIHEIIEVSKEYEVANLVTAMTIFRRYGRGDELSKFFIDYEKNSHETKEREKDLSGLIKKASDAIQLCDVNSFDDVIKDVANLRNKFNTDDKSIYGIVCKEIIDDYEPLINTIEGKGKNKYITQVKWCLDKGFIQQALTIIESKMPAEILSYGFFKNIFPKNDTKDSENDIEIGYTNSRYILVNDTVKHYIPKNNEQQGIIKLKELIEKKRNDWESPENYLIRVWGETLVSNKFKKFEYLDLTKCVKGKNESENLTNFWDNISKNKDKWIVIKKNGQSIDKNQSKRRELYINWVEKRDNKKEYYITYPIQLIEDSVKNDNTDNIENKVKKFIKLHMTLRNQRNISNHASSDERVGLDIIIKAIKLYIDIANELSHYNI